MMARNVALPRFKYVTVPTLDAAIQRLEEEYPRGWGMSGFSQLADGNFVLVLTDEAESDGDPDAGLD